MTTRRIGFRRPTRLLPFEASDSVFGCSVTIPLLLRSASNQRWHWREKAEATAHARGLTLMYLRKLTLTTLVESVMLTRVAPRRLDADNLVSSFKSVQDGVAEALGVDDNGWKPGAVRWSYEQEQYPAYGVRISLTYRGEP